MTLSGKQEETVTFECFLCAFSTFQETRFINHLGNFHSRIFSYWCKRCAKSFTNTNALVLHLQLRNCTATDLPCGFAYCSFCTKNPSLFTSHLQRSHKSTDLLPCVYCRRYFSNSHYLILHLQNLCCERPSSSDLSTDISSKLVGLLAMQDQENSSTATKKTKTSPVCKVIPSRNEPKERTPSTCTNRSYNSKLNSSSTLGLKAIEVSDTLPTKSAPEQKLQVSEANLQCQSNVYQKPKLFPDWADWYAMVRRLKTPEAVDELLGDEKIKHFFRCMQRSCHFSTGNGNDFTHHNENKHNGKFLICSYCFIKLRHPEKLFKHLLNRHRNQQFQCTACLYRGASAKHVKFHQKDAHAGEDTKIIKCKMHDPALIKLTSTLRLQQPEPKLKRTYNCAVLQCGYSTYVKRDFADHYQEEHPSAISFSCCYCNYETIRFGTFLKHFGRHDIHVNECAYCLFGSDKLSDVLTHICINHADKKMHVLERIAASRSLDDSTLSDESQESSLEVVSAGDQPQPITEIASVYVKNSKRRRTSNKARLSERKNSETEEETSNAETVYETVALIDEDTNDNLADTGRPISQKRAKVTARRNEDDYCSNLVRKVCSDGEDETQDAWAETLFRKGCTLERDNEETDTVTPSETEEDRVSGESAVCITSGDESFNPDSARQDSDEDTLELPDDSSNFDSRDKVEEIDNSLPQGKLFMKVLPSAKVTERYLHTKSKFTNLNTCAILDKTSKSTARKSASTLTGASMKKSVLSDSLESPNLHGLSKVKKIQITARKSISPSKVKQPNFSKLTVKCTARKSISHQISSSSAWDCHGFQVSKTANKPNPVVKRTARKSFSEHVETVQKLNNQEYIDVKSSGSSSSDYNQQNSRSTEKCSLKSTARKSFSDNSNHSALSENDIKIIQKWNTLQKDFDVDSSCSTLGDSQGLHQNCKSADKFYPEAKRTARKSISENPNHTVGLNEAIKAMKSPGCSSHPLKRTARKSLTKEDSFSRNVEREPVDHTPRRKNIFKPTARKSTSKPARNLEKPTANIMGFTRYGHKAEPCDFRGIYCTTNEHPPTIISSETLKQMFYKEPRIHIPKVYTLLL